MSAYELLKGAHVTAVAASYGLFLLRGVWLLRGSPRLHRGLDRILPHTVDTLLLAFGLALAWRTGQWPFVQPWLTAKLAGLVAYVLVGLWAFRGARTRRGRALGWAVAQGIFAYIVLVALTRDPLPFNWKL